MTDRLDSFSYVPGPDRPLWERVQYVRQRTIAELEIFADDVGADNVAALPSNSFIAGLRQCCMMIFRPQINGRQDYFKIDTADHALIYALAGVYMDICDRYNKVCSISGLSVFLGVSSNYIYSLSKYDNKRYNSSNTDNVGGYLGNKEDSNAFNVSNTDDASIYNNNISASGEFGNYEQLNSCSYVNILKSIKETKERQLQGLLIDGKGNLVGIIAILNHEFGYRVDGKEDDIPVLTGSERQQMLAEKYRVSALPDKLSDN